jgi:glyoxylase-like metal-dependent hydrolase (beta-lactamase superfamily II)
MPIFINTGKIQDNIYLIDTLQFGVHRITSTFCYWDGTSCVLMDVGTSDDVRNLLSVVKKWGITPKQIKCVILSHYHFDHGGGASQLYSKLIKQNPDFKIMVPPDTHDKLQNATKHLEGAFTTFGDYIGTMNPVEESAFQIVEKNEDLPIDLQSGYRIKLISTPGHTFDHVSPTIFHNGKATFMFTGETVGTLFNATKLVSLPTCMPPNFRFKIYMESLDKIINLVKLGAEGIGFCHFGAITGQSDILTFLTEHRQYMIDFRAAIKELYAKDPSTRYVIQNLKPELWQDRLDQHYGMTPLSERFFRNLQLALTYGMMIDLGYREPKYE